MGYWGNGMIITSDCGSFTHSLLSTSKKKTTQETDGNIPLFKMLGIPSAGPEIQRLPTRNRSKEWVATNVFRCLLLTSHPHFYC